MGVTKLKYHITISILAAFIVFAVVLIRYDQNQSELNQEKLPPETYSRINFSLLSQNIEVRPICNVNKVCVNLYFSDV